MAFKHTSIRVRTNAATLWHDPSIHDQWQQAGVDHGPIDVGVLSINIFNSDDGLTQTSIVEYEDIECCILSQKEIVSNELREIQKAYRAGAGISMQSETWEDTTTGQTYTLSDMIAKEDEMRAAGKLTAHRYMRT